MSNPIDTLAQQVPGLDLWQRRDWPHRRGDPLTLDLLSFPLTESSSGLRSHPCEQCGREDRNGGLVISDNILCWRCKGAFCHRCSLDDSIVSSLDVERVVKQGWGNCPFCDERFRSVALTDGLRGLIDRRIGGFQGQKHSLLDEAEWALEEGKKLYDQGQKKAAAAILKFTHAINAINYLVSQSNGGMLLLRTQDILLMSHAYRAELEGNPALRDTIEKKFPKASVKLSSKAPVKVDTKEFQAYFYSLPASFLAPAPGKLICADHRSWSFNSALRCKKVRQQLSSIELGGMPHDLEEEIEAMESSDKCEDATFLSLKGEHKGTRGHFRVDRDAKPGLCMLGPHSFHLLNMTQFMWVFPTKRAAAEYFRVKNEVTETSDVEYKANGMLKKEITGQLGGITKRIRVGVGSAAGSNQTSFLIMATLGCVVTKIIGSVGLDESTTTTVEELAILLGTRALSHIDSISKNPPGDNRNQVHDKALCTFCGKSCSSLLQCGVCKSTYYCNKVCQRNHWTMKGPFGHKTTCKSAEVQPKEETFTLVNRLHSQTYSQQHISTESGLLYYPSPDLMAAVP